MFHFSKTRLFKYIENVTTKNWKFSDENSNIFHISATHKLWEYMYVQSMLLSRNKKKLYTAVNSRFFII